MKYIVLKKSSFSEKYIVLSGSIFNTIPEAEEAIRRRWADTSATQGKQTYYLVPFSSGTEYTPPPPTPAEFLKAFISFN